MTQHPSWHPSWDRSSRRRLAPHHVELFRGDTLFDEIARTVCRANCLPRKELYEAWEVARRARRRFRGSRIFEACAGHALLSHLMLLLDDTSPGAIAVDLRRPPSAMRIATVLSERWPRLRDRIVFHEEKLGARPVPEDALVMSVHACGTLTDRVLDLAIDSRSRLTVMPCCHSHERCDTGSLSGWLDPSVAIDVTRAARLRAAGYDVRTQTIPDDITQENRLLMAAPFDGM